MAKVKDAKERLRFLEKNARMTEWLVADGAAGESAFGNGLTNAQWCVKEVKRRIDGGQWATVKRCGPLVAVFGSTIQIDRKEVSDADFIAIGTEIREAFERGKEAL